MAAGKIQLQKNSGTAIDPISEAGTRKDKEEYARLSEIIKVLNDRFGTNSTEADRLFFDQIEEEMVMDEKLSVQAKTNTMPSTYDLNKIKFATDEATFRRAVELYESNKAIKEEFLNE